MNIIKNINKNILIIIFGSIFIIGTYIYLVNSKKIERFITIDKNSYLNKINDSINNGVNYIIDYIKNKSTITITNEDKIPSELSNKDFNNDLNQFLSNNDIISSEIKRLENEIKHDENNLPN